MHDFAQLSHLPTRITALEVLAVPNPLDIHFRLLHPEISRAEGKKANTRVLGTNPKKSSLVVSDGCSTDVLTSPNDLYFRRSTTKNKVFSNQNKGSFGFQIFLK